MPLTPYQYRPATPPAAAVPDLIQGSHSRKLSNASSWSVNSSPDSIDIHVSTPLDRSPIRHHGPQLLPKIRTQDQSLGSPRNHRRALSQSVNPPGQIKPARPVIQRSTTVPPECASLLSPISATSTNFSSFSAGCNSAAISPINITPPFPGKQLGHSRSISTSSIEDGVLGRFGYPYRRTPSYLPGAYWNPSVIPGSAIFTPPATAPRAQVLCYDLPEEQRCEQPDEVTLTSIEYMNGPNPAVSLVRQVNRVIGRGMHSHFWWDIRNLEVWEDFSLDTIMAIRGFPELLNIPINESAFPNPQISPSRLHPESDASLIEMIRDFYAVKVNAALKVAQGTHRHMMMRVGKDRDGPALLSNYQDDAEKTISGNGRGRVVGIVRSYERWNSGMRSEVGYKKILYLEGLAHLHRHMREHQCRYGFVMTETELVCVRAGTADTPFFGHLELARVVETRVQSGLTASLALWFLHMLAKEEPLPGQCGWRLNVGAPAAMTRQHVMEEKDAWIPEPQTGEKRDAKRVRGWVMPRDPWNKKKEGGKAWNK